MKRLFLTSIGLGKFPSFVDKNPEKVNIGFIPTAADPYQDKWFVEEARNTLLKQGFNLIDIDIKDKSQLEKLKNVDAIYISGGNTFYLLEKALETDAFGLIKKLVNDGILYAGGSAGATFAGPSIEPVSLLDDPKDAPNLKTFRSLGLVNFVVIPHFGKDKYSDRQQKTMEIYKDGKYKLIPLTDMQAIIVEGNNFQIIDTN